MYPSSLILPISSIFNFLANIVGESYNTEDKQDVVAITYGIASDGGHSLQDLTVLINFF